MSDVASADSNAAPRLAEPSAPLGTEALALNHLGMRVAHIAEAIDWYARVLGFTLLDGPHRYERSQAPALMRSVYGTQWRALSQAHLASANGMGVELFEFEGAPQEPTPGWRPGTIPGLGLYHFCVTARLIEELADGIDASGGRVNTAVDEPAPGTYRMSYCEDPFGNALEINDRSYEQAHANRGQG